MLRRRQILKTFFLLGWDIVFLYISLFLPLYLRYLNNPDLIDLAEKHIIPFSIIFSVWLLVFGSYGLYNFRLAKNSKNFLYRLLHCMIINTLLATSILYLFPWQIEPRRNLFLIVVTATLLIFAWRYLFNLLILKIKSYRIIFLGANKEVLELTTYLLTNPQLKQKPMALIGEETKPEGIPPEIAYYSWSEDLNGIVQKFGADIVVITEEAKRRNSTINALFKIIPSGVWITDFTPFYESLTGKIPISLIGKTWFLSNVSGLKSNINNFVKRGLDIIIAIFLGIPTVFLFPFIAIAIKIYSPGPVLFKQERLGKNNRVFNLLKFRSTYRTAVEKNQGWDKEEKNIYTPCGKFLRRSYIDELPQIINVLRGEMSFVGPRPERPEFVEELKKQIPFYETRLLVQPGITGWAQINMEDDAAAKDAQEKIQYDLYYIKNRSFVLDLLIALKTASMLLSRKGK